MRSCRGSSLRAEYKTNVACNNVVMLMLSVEQKQTSFLEYFREDSGEQSNRRNKITSNRNKNIVGI